MSLQLTFELPPDVLGTREVEGDRTVLRNEGAQGGDLHRFVDGETDHSLYRDLDNENLRALANAVDGVEWAPRLAEGYHFASREDLETTSDSTAAGARAAIDRIADYPPGHW